MITKQAGSEFFGLLDKRMMSDGKRKCGYFA
jgi:hypothetical protein